MIFFDLDFEDEHILLKFNFSVVTLRDGQRAGFWRPRLTRPEIPGSGSEITGLTRSNSGPGQTDRVSESTGRETRRGARPWFKDLKTP